MTGNSFSYILRRWYMLFLAPKVHTKNEWPKIFERYTQKNLIIAIVRATRTCEDRLTG